MKGRRCLTSVAALMLLLVLTVGLSQAQGPGPQAITRPQAPVGSAFTYQGYLSDGGGPADGDYDMQFILYDALSGGSQVGSIVAKEDVAVTDGIFSVALDFGSVFDGTGLWLEAAVRPGSGTGYTILSPRQEITPAPYALYALDIPQHDHFGETWTGYADHGLYVQNYVEGVGIHAEGAYQRADVVLGGTLGIISSDPAENHSGMYLYSQDGTVIGLDTDGNSVSSFEVRRGTSTTVFKVDEEGNVSYGGTGLTAFPKPAYDSGWQAIGFGATTLDHNLGGDPNHYVVDLQMKDLDSGYGVNHHAYGVNHYRESDQRGVMWSNLTGTSITVYRAYQDNSGDQVRVRIWVY
ncbi:MAG: hypothetical protein PVG25_05920 [Anaerolineae bacterium]